MSETHSQRQLSRATQITPYTLVLWIDHVFFVGEKIFNYRNMLRKLLQDNHTQIVRVDSQCFWLLSFISLTTCKIDGNWRETHNNLQVTSSTNLDAERIPTTVYLCIRNVSSLVTSTKWASKSHIGTQCHDKPSWIPLMLGLFSFEPSAPRPQSVHLQVRGCRIPVQEWSGHQFHTSTFGIHYWLLLFLSRHFYNYSAFTGYVNYLRITPNSTIQLSVNGF